MTAAIYAFKHGADAVYVGLTEFSARAHARNFTLEQLGRLKGFAEKNGKRIYVAMNTVIRDCEMEQSARILTRLSFLEIDAILVQDTGLLHFIRRFFPHIRIHASTQMAVHNGSGVRHLKGLGIKRAILSRELSFDEIRAIREQNPDMELEVFIHGSLCYGFSGLCLASGIICGRSGNRGGCAQVCRTWFNGPKGKGYYFSCNDLQLAQEALRLKEIGIDALKIEGRMKSPEYTGMTVSLYRHIIDNAAADATGKDMCDAQVIFSRNPTPAFFNVPNGERMINREYPFHIGITAGKVIASEKQGFIMKTEQPIMVRDGLLFFRDGNPPEPVNFSVKGMLKGDKPSCCFAAPRSMKIKRYFLNKRVFSSVQGQGEYVYIESPSRPRKGDIIYKTSSHNLHWPAIKEGGIRTWKRPVDITVTLSDRQVMFASPPPKNPLADVIADIPISIELPINIEKSHKEVPFRDILGKVLGETGSFSFRPRKINLINNTSCKDDRIYIHPANLKKIKNKWYEYLQERYKSLTEEMLNRMLGTSSLPSAIEPDKSSRLHERQIMDNLPPRSGIIPRDADPVPFILDPENIAIESLPDAGGILFIPLHPIIFKDTKYLEGLLGFLKSHTRHTFAIGLNNIGHISWVNTLSALPHVSFFIDYGLYCANIRTFYFFMEHIPRLLFQYFWIEGSNADFAGLKARIGGYRIPLALIDKSFHPPLFISRACFVRHSLGSGCPKGCIKRFRYRLSQNKREFTLIVRDCMTYLF
ncbi:U32 family peptidase [bacterium]|nr:U32 family peptidase [bacterium]